MAEQIAEVFSKAVDLALASGASKIGEMAGCWECHIGHSWFIAINGHGESVACSKGTNVPPFVMYVEFNGWPAGFISPYDGCMAAGALANEDALIAAIDKALAEYPSCERKG